MRRSSSKKGQRGLAKLAGGFGLFGLLLFSLLLPIAQAQVCPAIGHPKDFTVLLADPYDTQPANGRTPLILVHGIYGDKENAGNSQNIQDHNLNYWSNFSQFFYYWGASSSSVLKDKFKLYYFFYQSNKICVNDIASGLRDWIDERTNQQQGTANKLQDVPFVIIAHSMGGLVSRAFMNSTVFNVGSFAGQSGGNRVIKLITLGTPHHGSIVANGGIGFGCLLSEASLWVSPFIQAASLIGWGINIGEPNRNDLLWDNYNGSISHCLAINDEVNQLLSQLNNPPIDNNKRA